MEPWRPKKGLATAFLLAQVGAHAAKQFANRLSAVGLAPHHAGILRRLAHAPGISQRELAATLGMHASRLVGVVDEMESLGLVAREGNANDRRTYSLQITTRGREKLAEISMVSRQHNEALCAALSEGEREVLAELLQRIADQQGLLHGVHPGFSSLGENAERSGKQTSAQAQYVKGIARSDFADS